MTSMSNQGQMQVCHQCQGVGGFGALMHIIHVILYDTLLLCRLYILLVQMMYSYDSTCKNVLGAATVCLSTTISLFV